MSPIDAEVLLVLALVALYLQDSASLLHFDEVLVAGDRRGWQVTTGSELEMRGRFLQVPNPLLPARTRFRASWLRPADGPAEDPEALARFAGRLWAVRGGCIVAGAALLVALPALLVTTHDPAWLLAPLGTAYLAIVAMLAALSAQRAALGLSRWKLAALCAESLLCPPHAINLYRRLCALRGFRGDPIAFAARTMPAPSRARLRAAIAARADLFTLADEDAGGQVAGLRAARARVTQALA